MAKYSFNFQQRVIAGFSVSLLMVISIGFISYQSTNKLTNNTLLVKHSYRVLQSIEVLEKLFMDAQTGQRGYVIAGNDQFLQPYYNAVDNLDSEIVYLKELTIDNPQQQAYIASINPMKREIMSFHQKVIELRKTDPAAAHRAVTQGDGKQMMDNIRAVCNEMRAVEAGLLSERDAESRKSVIETKTVLVLGSSLISLIVIVMIFYIRSTFRKQKEAEERLKVSNLELEALSEENKKRNWLLTGNNTISDALRGELEMTELANNVITELCNYLGAKVGALYVMDDNQQQLTLQGSYAFKRRKSNNNTIRTGEGLIGQCVLEQKLILFDNIPDDYLAISSGLGESKPSHLLLAPFVVNGKVMGVIEIGSVEHFSESMIGLVEMISESIAIAINAAQARIRMRELYERTQQQSEELISQQEELRQTNDELTQQTMRLQASEEELRTQQEELQQANAELEQKAQLLEEKNEAIEQARQAIAIKADEIEATSKYKSEFLANMSHELRTPLNSVLILAKLLSDNKTRNLNDKQIEYARVIHKSGNDLLTLINDILDLSKIEAGKIDLTLEEFDTTDVQQDINSLFKEIANDKKIHFEVAVSPQTPKRIRTDKVRLEQVIRNLFSNAFKFTPQNGRVSLHIFKADKSRTFRNESLYKADEVIAFEVKDTGIGIAPEKQKIVFEAFQQADGSTSRKYGGTGLGLSISRELAYLLGGEIQLSSEENKGSTFTVYLPVAHAGKEQQDRIEQKIEISNENTAQVKSAAPEDTVHAFHHNELPDDRHQLQKGKRTILIIEDDLNFASILKDFAHERNYQVVIAVQGDKGLQYADTYKPDAIILDMQLPVMDGWTVLKRLKENPELKNIPVHIMSGMDKEKLGLTMGAIAYMRKPLDSDSLERAFNMIESNAPAPGEPKHVLIIEDDSDQNSSIAQLINSREENAVCDSAYTGTEALEMIRKKDYSCIILDLGLSDVSGYELLEKIRGEERSANTPVVIYTGQELSREEEAQLKKLSSAIILKTNRSYERLLDETSIFLHKITQPQHATTLDRKPVYLEEVLKHKKVLLVDDDMRNIFALTTVLEEQQMAVVTAHNGREALNKLAEHKDTEIVLMDIMMPEMDGYEAMREIRKMPGHKNLPILALTAKAMQGDREKCLEAGASDYISKPVDIEQLFSLMRVWLYK
jgi:signal transduction histidine kinase/DNA-binding response OmpR family regulator/CHASE3 domain sensor protein